jgi:hypothetical protein
MVVLGPRVAWIASGHCQLPPVAPGPINIGTNSIFAAQSGKGREGRRFDFPRPHQQILRPFAANPQRFRSRCAHLCRAAELAGAYRADGVPGVPGGGGDGITQLHRTRAKRAPAGSGAGPGGGAGSSANASWLARIRVEDGQIVSPTCGGCIQPRFRTLGQRDCCIAGSRRGRRWPHKYQHHRRVPDCWREMPRRSAAP